METELQNPGFEAPTNLTFDTIPSLFEFFRHGGVPGVAYMFVTPQNMPKAQSQGWQQILGVPFFTVGGLPCTIMAKGEPLTGTPAQPGTSKCLVFADTALPGGVEVTVGTEPAAIEAPKGPKLRHEPANPALLATK